jgi:hypothetical protein
MEYTNYKDAVGLNLHLAPGVVAVGFTKPGYKLSADGTTRAYQTGNYLTTGQTVGSLLGLYANYVDGNGAWYNLLGDVNYITDSASQADYKQFDGQQHWIGTNNNGTVLYYPYSDNAYMLLDGTYLSLTEKTTPGSGTGAGGAETNPGQAGGTDGNGSGNSFGDGTTGSGLPIINNPFAANTILGFKVIDILKWLAAGLILLLLLKKNKNEN